MDSLARVKKQTVNALTSLIPMKLKLNFDGKGAVNAEYLELKNTSAVKDSEIFNADVVKEVICRKVQAAYDLRMPTSLCIEFRGDGSYSLSFSKFGEVAGSSITSVDAIMQKVKDILDIEHGHKYLIN